jgi:hypothetical protein
VSSIMMLTCMDEQACDYIQINDAGNPLPVYTNKCQSK